MYRAALVCILVMMSVSAAASEDFYLDSPYNRGILVFEIDNDIIWESDSNFTYGSSIQYNTVCYESWEKTQAPGFIKWVGEHFPTLGDDDSIVRYGQGIERSTITPEDIENPNPPEGDLPYAGIMTYSLNWQSFNRKNARNFQVTAGLMGKEVLAGEVQKFAHNRLHLGDAPQGWDTQRDTEPILNIAYEYNRHVAGMGDYMNDWAWQTSVGAGALLGNLMTAAEMKLVFRFGWNMPEGFNSCPAPPGRGFYQNFLLPKPAASSPHGFDVVLCVRGTGFLYSVVYDGSLITGDDRKVDREDYMFTGILGLNYYYYNFMSVRLALVRTSDFIIEESLPDPRPDQDKMEPDNSYGTLMFSFYF